MSDIDRKLKEEYYLTPEMIRFLLADNLAMKQMLLSQGTFDVDSFNCFKEQAEKKLDAKVDAQLAKWKAEHPEILEAVKQANVTLQAALSQTAESSAVV